MRALVFEPKLINGLKGIAVVVAYRKRRLYSFQPYLCFVVQSRHRSSDHSVIG